MHFRFDENDDLVVDGISDDLMDKLNWLAFQHGRTSEDEMRDVLMKLAAKWKGEDK